MKAIILARVSDKKQDSNEAQVNRISDYVRYKELTVWKTFEIEESSTKGDREKFQEVVKEIIRSKEPIALVVDTVDRLQRSFRESVQLDDLRKAGKLCIHFYRENLVLHKDSNSADLLRWDMAVMFARSYVLQLSDNVKRKFEQKRRNGELVGKAPIGYLNIGTEKAKDVIADPKTAHLIQKMFALYATGNYSMLTLRDHITKEGLLGDNGKPIGISMVEHILKNPFYYGEMLSRGNLYPHKYQPLIAKSQYDKCQAVRLGWGKKPFQYAAKPFIFRGLITCATCGCTMSPEIKKGKYVYYSCTNARKAMCNKKVYVSEKELLMPVYEVLNALKSISQEKIDTIVEYLKQSCDSKDIYHRNSLESLRQEYDGLQEKIQRLTDLLLDGTVTKEIYDMKLRALKNRQRDIDWQLKNHTEADENYYITASTVLNLAKNALDIFESSEVPEKRKLLNFMLQNCTCNGKKLTFTMKTPFEQLYAVSNHPIGLRDLDAFGTLDWEFIKQGLQNAPSEWSVITV